MHTEIAHQSSLDSRAAVLTRRERAAATVPRAPRQLTARQRIDRLCDAGSFLELSPLQQAGAGAYGASAPGREGDGVVVGLGRVEGRPVAVVAHDFSAAGGSIGSAFAEKVTRVQRAAIERRCPIVYLNDSAGARIHEGVQALDGCGAIFALNVAAQRVVPQVSVILGPCAGAAAYSPALTDWVIMVNGQSQMFLTGPEVVRAATGESIDPEELGGATLHTRESGVAHLASANEDSALAAVRQLLAFIPSASGGALPLQRPLPPAATDRAALPGLVPANPRSPFDVRRVLAGILDDRPQLELMSAIGPSLLTGFAHLDGVPVGVVASQPKRRGGILDARTATKAARFVNFCGRFGVPILTFVDVPGFLPGSAEERRAVITHGAELVAAYVGANVPKLTVTMRKAYGGAYIAMGARSLGAQLTWAWPDAELAVMGPEAAVGLLHRREMAAATDAAELRRALAARYRAEVTPPSVAAAHGIIDDVILPEETRDRLATGLRFLLGLGPTESTGSAPLGFSSLTGLTQPT